MPCFCFTQLAALVAGTCLTRQLKSRLSQRASVETLQCVFWDTERGPFLVTFLALQQLQHCSKDVNMTERRAVWSHGQQMSPNDGYIEVVVPPPKHPVLRACWIP